MKKQKVNRILYNVQGGGKNILLTLLFVILFNVAYSQNTTKQNHWYFGASGGTELGQCTFRSITDDKNKLGGTVGIFGGYELSPVFSVEAAANIGSMKLHAQECDPFWLSDEQMELGRYYELKLDYEKLSPYIHLTGNDINDWQQDWTADGEILNPAD